LTIHLARGAPFMTRIKNLTNISAVITVFGIATGLYGCSSEEKIPDSQRKFQEIIYINRSDYDDAKHNELRAEQIYAKRNKELCEYIKTASVKGWIGEVTSVTGSDGNALIKVSTGDNITLLNTRGIGRASPVYKVALDAEIGQKVGFSGRFIKNGGCFAELSATHPESIDGPNFDFEFSELSRIE